MRAGYDAGVEAGKTVSDDDEAAFGRIVRI